MKRLLAILLLLIPALASAASLQPLSAADVPALLQPPAHGARIIAAGQCRQVVACDVVGGRRRT